MREYTLISRTPVTADIAATQLYAAYADRKDQTPVWRYTGSGQVIVTEGRLPFPDERTSFGQRPIVLQVSINGGATVDGATATSFKVSAGSEMRNPNKLPEMIERAQAAFWM